MAFRKKVIPFTFGPIQLTMSVNDDIILIRINISHMDQI